eukprot:31518-Pelagococcus_subviridis.AAC.4
MERPKGARRAPLRDAFRAARVAIAREAPRPDNPRGLARDPPRGRGLRLHGQDVRVVLSPGERSRGAPHAPIGAGGVGVARRRGVELQVRRRGDVPLAGRLRGGRARPAERVWVRAVADVLRASHLFVRGAPQARGGDDSRRGADDSNHELLLFRQRGAVRARRSRPPPCRGGARREGAAAPRRAPRAERGGEGGDVGPADEIRAGRGRARGVHALLRRDAAGGDPRRRRPRWV